MDLKNTSAIVTGGASGLGAAVVRALAGHGAEVFALDLPGAIQESVLARGVQYVPADVTDADDVRQAVARAAAGAPLRTVINCAGVLPTMRILGRRGVHDPAVFAKVIQVNLIGSFNILAMAAEAISLTQADEHGQRGVVINTASIAAFEGQIGQVAYAASKAGIVGLTLPAARDLGQYGIRVNAIAPGVVETPMMASVSDEVRQALAASVTFPKRLASPNEFAQLALSIIENDYINGETIRMDGALRMAPQ
jgi:NAD(P)-dependent dehydrogenase (short-subunit alcohol dehydrogenase family)